MYSEGTDDEESDESGVLPPLHEGQMLDLRAMVAQEKFTQKPARFSEASLGSSSSDCFLFKETHPERLEREAGGRTDDRGKCFSGRGYNC